MRSGESKPNGLSSDELKTLVLGLAHLAHFLPEWQVELGRIAGKLDAVSGPVLFAEFMGLQRTKSVVKRVLQMQKTGT